MNPQLGVEQGLRDWLREQEAAPGYLTDVFAVTSGTAQRRPSIVSRLLDRLVLRGADRRVMNVVLVGLLLAALVGTTLGVGAILRDRLRDSTVVPLIWTPAALEVPYPAPLRDEPSGGASTVAGAFTNLRTQLRWVDVTGDTKPGNDPRVDLTRVTYYRNSNLSREHFSWVRWEIATPLTEPLPEPQSEWLSYGIVVDKDGDGRPDVRLGIDNVPGGASTGRAWHTDLRTGETRVVIGGPGKSMDGFYGESEFPMMGQQRPGIVPTAYFSPAYFWVSPYYGLGLTGRFYMWAALIRDGRIVAIDFAPDTGWLQPLPEPAPEQAP